MVILAGNNKLVINDFDIKSQYNKLFVSKKEGFKPNVLNLLPKFYCIKCVILPKETDGFAEAELPPLHHLVSNVIYTENLTLVRRQ